MVEVESFYKYLISNGYYFDKELIENYLLSLKVKPFVILTGNSGTGKTKLSQLFAQYLENNAKLISKRDHNSVCYHNIMVSTGARSWGYKKKDKTTGHECGWSLSQEYFVEALPINSICGTYEIEVNGLTTTAGIEFVPQLYYDKKNKELIKYFEELYWAEEEQIKFDKSNGNSHKKQLVDLGIDCQSLSYVILNDCDLESDEITINMTISSFIARNRVLLSWDLFDYIPFKKSVPCNIIAGGITSTATFYPKFRLFNHLTDEIKKYLEDVIEENKIQWFTDNAKKLKDLDDEEINKKWENFKKNIPFKLKIKNFKPVIDNFEPKWNIMNVKSEIDLTNYILEPSHKSKHIIIPIGANWTDNTNIVGYHNVITGKYQPTPAYDFIEEANVKNNCSYFLILDEMNLSHVERYFADFLSAIESGEEIPLYGEDKTLKLPENLFIIGTVNVDETTYMFSPKVLDRANTIEFDTLAAWDYMVSVQDSTDFEGDIGYLQSPLIDSDISELNIEDLKEIFSEISYNGDSLWDTLAMELTAFQETLKGSGFDFGFRVINEILRFMVVAWRYENSPSEWNKWERYFDAQIKQKILPKLHGSEKAIGNVLTNLFNICLVERNNNENPKNFNIIKEDCRYYTSAVKLQNMSKVLSDQRYVSFIN
ncbi:MAG: hypothetical protein U0L42_11085 [Methanobrevibacter sp.]|uniref:hypothetical protein n=1 Tax=Methanobrevibacter sp. TaxID=66852 RepID=UPI002E7796F8|nr:hypothetical protein [Methanobrevibacter sp.]MEE0936197.1 hypothetical protein [Methanobrevibacter sp.]